MNEELLAAVRQAIAGTEAPDTLLTLEATAAIEAMLALGFVQATGWEYAWMTGDALVAQSFNTAEQADTSIRAQLRLGEGEPIPAELVLVRRPVGVWEPVGDSHT